MTTLLERIFCHRGVELPGAVRRHRGLRRRLDRRAPIAETEFVAFDTELTGLDVRRDSIISIGAVRLLGGRILPGQTFYRLVRPCSELRGESVCVHELTHADLASAAEPEDALADFLDFAGDGVLMGHFVFIDVGFLDRALREAFGVHLESPAVDTMGLHDWLNENDSRFARHHGGMTLKNDLFSMAARYGIEVAQSHNALFDAYLAAQLFQRFLSFLSGCGVSTLGELLAVGKS
jgi:DNA polymerase-3 subunit epsilon